MATWQVQEAKSRLSELIERAQKEGPQTITKHGRPKAVLLSAEAYEALEGKRSEPNLIRFLLNSGPILEGVDLQRDKSRGREVDLG
jgi:prevent-host-death family protein